ncbi:glucose-6-phosphate isomerase [Burkholderiaceae bacterium FT117]|uniref:glucose-6-phosphate isomerase n=1 Tax=Zeimonas sediminis TaxID=2944268 RepID=UPI002342EA1F|nr:glucose-6-phosphate isomerase [Zeimonas sediminis]MCM5569077.1 glucose-6-phosphate isomerase [Zeimonas sediminis]
MHADTRIAGGFAGDSPLPASDEAALAAAWKRVETLSAEHREADIEALFEMEPDRLRRFVAEAGGLRLDISRNRLPRAALDALVGLAEAAGVADWRDAMFDGRLVNNTEGRAVLHVALRARTSAGSRAAAQAAPAGGPARDRLAAPLRVGDEDIRLAIRDTLSRMRAFSESVREGRWRGATGRPITDVVNVGIGGSQLGPELVCQALAHRAHRRIRVHFLSNVDPDAWRRLAAGLDPATTLAVVASKSWRTQETALNASAVRDWMLAAGVAPQLLRRHFVGVTANPEGARSFGLGDEAIFPFGDWVGGRYSLWSAIGLPAMLSIGPDAFDEMLAGAHAMDRHFADAPLRENAPVLLALASLWNGMVHPGGTEAVVPYCAALARLPAWLQQLQMESNGKRVDRDGRPVARDTATVCWGEPGTDAQHSFFQALHQGTRIHPVDFVIALPCVAAGGERGPAAGPDHADPGAAARATALVANAIAQAEALMRGRRPDPADPLGSHRQCPGNRPSNTILLEALTPASLGALLALYEHKTAVLGWLWRIDSFDQWGVELGKTLAAGIEPLLSGDASPPESLSAPSRALLERIRSIRARTPG